jgi:hypothetical protein
MEKYTLNQIKEKGLQKLVIDIQTEQNISLVGTLKKTFRSKKRKSNEEKEYDIENAIALVVREKSISVASNDEMEKYITNREKLKPELKSILSYKCSNNDVKYLYKVISESERNFDGEMEKETYLLFTRIENLKNGLYNVKSWKPYNEKNTLGRIVKGVLKSFSPLEFLDKNLTFNELKDFKETISDYKIVDLEKLDEIAEEIYKNYIEFEIVPLEVNDLDTLF